MYKSPVEVYVNDMLNQIHQQEENQIVAEVSKAVGINVEKEELIKALNYDRNQYEKGYEDAMRRNKGKWIEYCYQNYECSECGVIIADSDVDEYKYCPNCGAKMGVEENG